jgi:hypothetical protein
VRVSCPNDGAEVVAISWMVLTAPELTLKLVALKLARPFTALVASLMVMVVAELETLPADAPCKVSAPVRLLTLETPAEPPPPPLVRQVGQVRLPAASRAIGPVAETATVPVAFGMVIVLFELLGVAKVRLLVMPALVAVRLTVAP